MTSYKNGIALGRPPTLDKQLEVLRAARTLLAQERDDADRRRRDEIAALRRRAVDLVVQQVEELRRELDPRLRSRVIRYNADESRVPRGDHGGGEWTSGGTGSAIDTGGTAAPDGSRRGPQYAQADSGTRTDAMDDGGNASAAAAQQYPDSWHDAKIAITDIIAHFLGQKTADKLGLKRDFPPISASQIPTDSPKRPVPFCDSSDQPILDDQRKPLVRPQDLPPEAYVQAGLAAKSRGLPYAMHEVAEFIRGHSGISSGEDSSGIAMQATLVAYELLPFVHGGSFDAERTDSNYINEYRHYTSIALGIFMAAAGVSKEDMLTIADFYASIFSTFHEKPDPQYTHSTEQDIQDNLRGYELYKSGRIRLEN